MSVLLADQAIHGYHILRLLGKGGLAEVYEVEAEKTGALYALKVFVCEQSNAIFLKKRFWSEARILSKLHHPRIVRVYDYGYVDTEEKTPYYVMDLVLDETGVPCSLRDALERGLSTEERIAAWYGDLVEALSYIHGKGVIHRDVSLENALLGPDGRVVLSDFGVCKILDRDLRAEMNQTLVTMMSEGRPLMGKAFYIAPEVRAGKSETPASDLYSLGVLLFYLLNQAWYTPGAKIEDLLALFDEQWQTILPALLNVNPDLRHSPKWVDPQNVECARLEGALSEKTAVCQKLQYSYRRLAYALLAGLIGGIVLGGGLAFRVHTEERRLQDEAEALCGLEWLDIDEDDASSFKKVQSCASMMVLGALRLAKIDPSRSAADRILESCDKIRDSEEEFCQLVGQAAFSLFAQERNEDGCVKSLTAILNGDEESELQKALLKKCEDVDKVFSEKIQKRMAAPGADVLKSPPRKRKPRKRK